MKFVISLSFSCQKKIMESLCDPEANKIGDRASATHVIPQQSTSLQPAPFEAPRETPAFLRGIYFFVMLGSIGDSICCAFRFVAQNSL